MKLATSIIMSTVSASHYRGGTYKYAPNADGTTADIVNTQTWRKGSDLYNGGCNQGDVDNQIQSDSALGTTCSVTSGGLCSAATLHYTALFVGDDYCYGDGNNNIPKPTSGFTLGWSSCCWVGLTTDQGTYTANGSTMVQYMKINDVNNTTPMFKLPPLWLIMSGCPAQQVDLAPTDADGDNVKCRWATASEAGGSLYSSTLWPSLSLDEENCIVTYDGTMDASTVGVKPIGLMMEDFDSNGNVRSSIPVQFLAQVWTPNMNTRSIGYDNYPRWFDGDEHPDHVDAPTKKNSRGRRSIPSYCNAVPVFVAPTPADGAVINGSSGNVSFTLAASSQNGYITGFSYQSPAGMSCTTVNTQGQITCTWAMTSSQIKQDSHSFCYDATDSLGLVTGRQCLSITGAGSSPITNIIEMATAVLDGSGANGFTTSDGEDYGCAGRGMYDPFAQTLGKQIDAQDKAFYSWKKCVQCAAGDKSGIKAYDYDQDADSCGKLYLKKEPLKTY